MAPDLEHDSFQAKSDAFWKWVQQRPGTIISPKIRIADLRDQDQGRGIVATKDIEEEEDLFTIPLSDILTAQNSALSSQKAEDVSKLQIWDALVLAMIYEDGKGEESAWWPYLNILPTEFDTLMYWSSTELAELQGSTVVNKIGKDQAETRFRNDLLPITQSDPALFGRHAALFVGPDAEANFLQIAHRMATLIMAYGFDLDSKYPFGEGSYEDDEDEDLEKEFNKGMVPLADLLNADGELNNAHLVQNETTMTMVAIEPIKAGQQVFNDFGNLPRSDLLRRYGYLSDEYKKWDVVEIPTTLICEVAGKYNSLSNEEKEKRLDLASEWKVAEDGYDLSWPMYDMDFQFPIELQLLILTLIIDESDYNREKIEQNKPWETEVFARPLNMYQVLRDTVLQRQSAYSTTIAQDIKILQDASLNKRHRMAVEVRLGEKKILAMALDAANKWIKDFVEEGPERDGEDQALESGKRRKI